MADDAPHTTWRSLWLGFAVGGAIALLGTVVVLALTFLGGWMLLATFAHLFGKTGTLLAVAAGLAITLGLALLLLRIASRWAGNYLASWQASAGDWLAAIAGALCALVLAWFVAPEALRDPAVRLATGRSIEDHKALPATDADRQRMQTQVRPAALADDPQAQVELGIAQTYGVAGEARDEAAGAEWIRRAAKHPDGVEARLLLAVNLQGEPMLPSGRVQTASDVNAKVRALLAQRNATPAPWLPVLFGAMGKLQIQTHSGTSEQDQSARDSFAEAGLAGSRAYAIYAAQLDEGWADALEADHQYGLADPAWRRALEGYSRAGAIYEVERMRAETLPVRLRDLQVHTAAKNLPHPDAALAQRLWRFARMLMHERTRPGERDLAGSVALLAIERTPANSQLAASQLKNLWSNDPWALGRWLMLQRYAQGDCGAAFALSDATLIHRRSVHFNQDQETTPFDIAWARAWAERAVFCASPDERKQAHDRLANLTVLGEYHTSHAVDLKSSRDGVASMIKGLP